MKGENQKLKMLYLSQLFSCSWSRRTTSTA